MKVHLPMKIPIGPEYQGLLIYDHPEIVIEIKKWSWSEWKYEIFRNTIELSDIESIKIFNRGIFETRIDFQIKSLKKIEDIPNISGKIIFQFRLKYKKKALNFGVDLQVKLSEMNLKELDEEIEKIEKEKINNMTAI